MTKTERESAAIAKALVKAISRLESFMDDPSMVLEDARIDAHSMPKGVRDAIEALRKHYEGEG